MGTKSEKEHYFRIEEFRRPEFEVSSMIQSPIGHYCHPTVDQCVIATCEAKLLAGGCLSNASVQWTIQAQTTKFTPPNRHEYMFGGGNSLYHYSNDCFRKKISYPKLDFQVNWTRMQIFNCLI